MIRSSTIPRTDTRLRRFLANRTPGTLTQRTTRGVFQRPIRSVNLTANANNVPRWG